MLQPGLWTRNSNFGLRIQLQASKSFGFGSNLWKLLAPAPNRFGPLEAKNLCIICTIGLLHKLFMSVELELMFKAPAPPFKTIWPIQNCLGSCSRSVPRPWFQFAFFRGACSTMQVQHKRHTKSE